MLLTIGVINVPTKVGKADWRECWEETAERAELFGVNESSPQKQDLWIDLADEHDYGQYGSRISPNPVFWDQNEYRSIWHKHRRIHGPAGGWWSRKYQGYNAARYTTENVLRRVDGDGPDIAHIHTHWVPNGRKVNPVWRRRMRKISKQHVRELINFHHKRGRVVVLTGDLNIRLPFFMVKGWIWLRGTGVDKIGILMPKGWKIKTKSAGTYTAPTDHKKGAYARVHIVKAA